MSTNNPFTIGTTQDDRPANYHPEIDGHLLVTGSTGAGKTEILKTILTDALAGGSHAYVFSTLDHGDEFAFARTPETRFATELDAAADLMTALQVEVRIRRELALAHGFASVQELPDEVRPADILAVIDESSSLLGSPYSTPHDKIMHDHILEVLSSLLRGGRAAGVSVLLSTHPDFHLQSISHLLPSFHSRLLLGQVTRAERQLVLGENNKTQGVGGSGYGVYQRGSTGKCSPIMGRMISREYSEA